MSSECNFEIEHGVNDQGFLENPQAMIIANDVEAEAEDDEDENEDDDLNADDSENNLVSKFDDHHHRRMDSQINDANNSKQSEDENNSDESQSESSSGSESENSSSDSSEEGEDSSDQEDEEDQNEQTSKQIEIRDEEEEEEEEDEDEEVDIDTMNGSKSQDQKKRSESESQQQQLKAKQEIEVQQKQSEDKINKKQSTDKEAKANQSSKQIEEDHQEEDQEQSQEYQDEDEIEKNCDENGVYKWKEFSDAKIKTFGKEEFLRFQTPFGYGWKRELVLRCSGSTADKKAGDVYYHTPDGSSKLRSYVEMNQYLKRNPQITNLNVTHFTFAKQPIYRPPDEIVRHAMQRGANFVERPFAFNQHIRPKHLPRQHPNHYPQQQQQQNQLSNSNSKLQQQQRIINNSILSNEDSNDQDLSSGSASGILGRGKRKRVLPSRYDDNEIDLIPVNKKSKQQQQQQQNNSTNVSNRESYSNSNSNDGHSPQSNKSTGSTSKMSAQERRRALQQQLYQQVNEEVKRELEEKERTASLNSGHSSISTKDYRNNRSLRMKIVKQQNGNRRVDNQQNNNYHNDKVDNSSHQDNQEMVDMMDQQMMNDDQQQNYRQPCSNNCPGRRNMVPNLMCYRCFCLFHLDCVPDGVFLKNPKVFICPNCLVPEDQANAEGSTTVSNANGVMNKNTSSTKLNHKSNQITIEAQTNPNSLLLKQKQPMMASQHKYSSINCDVPSSNHKKLKRKQQQPESMIMNGFHSNKMNVTTQMNQHPYGSSTSSLATSKNLFQHNGYYKYSLSRRIVPPYPSYKLLTPSRSSSSSPPPVSGSNIKFQPSINHIYRLAQGANGHAVVIKDKTQSINLSTNSQTPLMANAISNNFTMNYLKQATQLLNEKQVLLNSAAQMARTQYYSTLNNNYEDHKIISSTGLIQSINISSKWYKYQQKYNNILNRFDSMMIILTKIIDYLDFKDIINLRNTSKQWYQLLSIPAIWRYLRLRNTTISDWSYFGLNILRSKSVKGIDFIGIRIPINQNTNDQSTKLLTRNEKICNFWHNFSTIHPSLDQIESLKFGTIPLFVIKDFLNYYDQQKSKVSSKIQQLIVMNLFDETKPNDSCSLEFFCRISIVKNTIKTIHLDSQNGFILNDSKRAEQFQSILATLKQLNLLDTFSCTSFKNFTLEEYSQLFANLDSNKIQHLSIGSCSGWFTGESPETLFENIGKFSNILSLRLRDVNIVAASTPLVNLFESLIIVERLTFENIFISKSAKITWTSLSAMLKSLPLVELRLTSSEPFTNRSIFETLIQLLSTQKRFVKIYWSVTVNIDDLGHCYVPLSLDSFTCQDDIDGHMFIKKYMDLDQQYSEMLFQIVQSESEQSELKQMILIEMDSLNELIVKKVQSRSRTIGSSIQIIPQ